MKEKSSKKSRKKPIAVEEAIPIGAGSSYHPHARASIRLVRRKLFSHVWVKRGLVLGLLVGVIWFIGSAFFGLPLVRWALSNGPEYTFIFSQGSAMLRSQNGLTNVLVLGVSGGNHEGADLTDSMMVFSYNRVKKQAVLLSIPRDLWIGEFAMKINAVYPYGEGKTPGGGLPLAKSVVEEVTGLPFQYGVVLDFSTFQKTIDLLGGVNICVDQSFDDYHYPIAGMENAEPESARYEHLHFDAGCQSMDGTRALKFVRSRYAEGEEGTDYARSRRQQKVIQAIERKVLTPEVMLQLPLIEKLVQTVRKGTITDIKDSDYPAFARLVLDLKGKQLVTGQIDQDDDKTGHIGLLVNPPISPTYQYQWVLVPKGGPGDWVAIHEYVAKLVQ
jgi:LCP family protein required for cell wall assembly